MRVLVTGAAGYIGSVVTELLSNEGHHVVALDNLEAGHRYAVDPAVPFLHLDLLNRDGLREALRDNPMDAVVHLAAEALVDVSVRDPGRFYRANVVGGVNLLDAMVESGITRIVFSSTAAVYGEPRRVPILEDDPHEPVNSYGETKLVFERMLEWYRIAHGFKYISLRYFNAAGATERCGEFHVPETHIIPILFEAATGARASFSLFGTDYDTPDGTCIRDYIHVADIARAHILALNSIDQINGHAYNMGNGSGYSNLEVIKAVQDITGKEIPVVHAARRPGDPARLIASSDRLREELGWVPSYRDLAEIIATAWKWRQRHPQGYQN